MPAGRPQQAEPGTLYVFAHDFYWTFRRINEGYLRWEHDEAEYRRLVDEIDSAEIDLSADQKRALVRLVREKVADGSVHEADKITRLREMGIDNLGATRQWRHMEAGRLARKQVQVPGKPGVLKALMEAKSPEEVRAICKDAFVLRIIEPAPGISKEVMWPNWPIPLGSMFPQYLSEHAHQFIVAKNDKRFPASGRPSSELKQLWFLSRVLAGAVFGVKARTAINLVGSARPEEVFQGSRNAKPRRKRARRN